MALTVISGTVMSHVFCVYFLGLLNWHFLWTLFQRMNYLRQLLLLRFVHCQTGVFSGFHFIICNHWPPSSPQFPLEVALWFKNNFISYFFTITVYIMFFISLFQFFIETVWCLQWIIYLNIRIPVLIAHSI